MILSLKKGNYKLLPIHVPSLIITILLLGLSFITEKHFIVVEDPNPYFYYSSKILFVIVVYCVISFLFNFITQIIDRNAFHLKWGKYFSMILIPYLVILFLSWPGIIIWDEFWIYKITSEFKLEDWQSYITQYYYLINFYLFPSFGTVVFSQIITFSFVSSWFITNISERYANRYTKIIIFVLIVIMLAAPAIVFNLLITFRSTFIALLELWLIGLIIFKKDTYGEDRTVFLWIMICVVLLSYWRKEGVYHLLLVPVAIYFTFAKINLKLVIKLFLICIAGFILLSLGSSFAKDENISLRYQLTAYINPLSVILADKNVNLDGVDIKLIDKVVDVNKLKEHSYHYEIPAYWNGAVRDGINTSDIKNFRNEYIKLVSQNFDIFLSSRVRTLLGASGMSKYGFMPDDYYDIFQSSEKAPEHVIQTYENKFNLPINNEIRMRMMKLLNWTTERNGYFYNAMLFWNFIILAIPMTVYILRVNSFRSPLWWGAIIIWIRLPLLYLTQPASYFMYYFPFYLAGIFVLFLWMLEVIEMKANRLQLKN